ncbi:MAG: helix-turn-helix transcriptional regulator [Clostridiales bacterium]|nr:helix-turn-helix transcriptional regulator [Clostridiales bacterium]
MTFGSKLAMLRHSRGYSQETLAEKLNISRQAVSKWENGQSEPEIASLLAISRLFQVTVDYLVREDTDCKQKKTIPGSALQPQDEALLRFLARASKETYAGYGEEAAASRPASHDYHYQEEDWLYIDTWLGGQQFAGEEAVWKDGQPVYAMNYCGRVLGSDFSGDFLKAALRGAPDERPFRGPARYEDGDNRYECTMDGSLDWFQGYEEIRWQGEKVYECFFHGGRLR